jgi:hypothetical protein
MTEKECIKLCIEKWEQLPDKLPTIEGSLRYNGYIYDYLSYSKNKKRRLFNKLQKLVPDTYKGRRCDSEVCPLCWVYSTPDTGCDNCPLEIKCDDEPEDGDGVTDSIWHRYTKGDETARADMLDELKIILENITGEYNA